MTLPFDPADDFSNIADATESVTLLRRGSSPGSPGAVITHALRRGLTTQQAESRNRSDTWKSIASGGRYLATDVVWHLPVVELEEAPRLGDRILDVEAQRWTILDVHHATMKTRWQCTTRNLAIAHGLDNAVSILKAEYTRGATGASETMWRPWRTGVRARIQRAENRVVTQRKARQEMPRFRIVIDDDISLNHAHCIQSADGTIYKIRSTNAAERIGELQTIEAELAPWTVG